MLIHLLYSFLAAGQFFLKFFCTHEHNFEIRREVFLLFATEHRMSINAHPPPLFFELSRDISKKKIGMSFAENNINPSQEIEMSAFLKVLIIVTIVLIVVFFAWSDEIHSAAQRGDVDAVKALVIKDPGSIHAKDQDGRTPLHWACRGVHYDVIKHLVEKGADVNTLDNNRITPLHSLASRNHRRGIEFLLSNGAEIDTVDFEQHTALHFAAMSDRKEAVAVLIEHGAGLELKDDYGRTPLLLCARERGGSETTRILLEGGADVNVKDRSGSTPLELSAWRGKREVVDLLLEAGAEVPLTGRKAVFHLIFAASKGLTNLFERMDEGGADLMIELSSKGTLLHEAAAGGSLDIFKKLAAKGLDVNHNDKYGWTPMHYAAKNGHAELIRWLLENGGNINSRNIMGESAYNISDSNKQESVKKFLTDMGADTKPVQFPEMTGEYLGQNPPGEKPEIFALGIVSSIWGLHSTVAFSPDGSEALWAPMVDVPGSIYTKGIIFLSKRDGDKWTAPQPAPFSSKFDDDVPFFAPDGKRLYFISSRPLPETTDFGKERIWYVDRTDEGWSDAKPLDPIINDSQMHWQFSLDSKGNIYFGSRAADGFGMGDIYYSSFDDGCYTTPKNLGPTINTDADEGTPFISPDGSYLLFNRSQNLYISFPSPDGVWTEARSLGAQVNTPAYELCPMISPDGKYLFFISNRSGEIHAWWMEAAVIESFKLKIMK